MKVKKTNCVGTLHADMKNIPPVKKNKKMKKEHFDQHSGDGTVLPSLKTRSE
jgi:hypothetical protein